VAPKKSIPNYQYIVYKAVKLECQKAHNIISCY